MDSRDNETGRARGGGGWTGKTPPDRRSRQLLTRVDLSARQAGPAGDKTVGAIMRRDGVQDLAESVVAAL